MPSSVWAHTTATSAMVPIPIQRFRPFKTHSEPSLRAKVFMLAGSLPASGSVRPKQPIASPLAILGSHSFFCSSEPNLWMALIASEPCTLTKVLSPESPASSSMQARPYSTALLPAQPYPERCMPSSPFSPISGTISLGKTASSHHCATFGFILSPTNERISSRVARSSSESRTSRFIKSRGSGDPALEEPARVVVVISPPSLVSERRPAPFLHSPCVLPFPVLPAAAFSLKDARLFGVGARAVPTSPPSLSSPAPSPGGHARGSCRTRSWAAHL